MHHNVVKKEVKGKGYGYIAENDVLENTILLKEKPFVTAIERKGKHVFDELLFVVEYVLDKPKKLKLFNELAPKSLEEVVEDTFFINFKKQLAKYLNSKHTLKKKYNFQELVLMCLRYKRNVFGTTYYKEKGVMLKEGSIFNHSCDPNCIYYYDDSTDKMVFKTCKNIKSGEELCISYVDPSQRTETRQMDLELTYGFLCRCSLCY